jgi:hypothetical protein
MSAGINNVPAGANRLDVDRRMASHHLQQIGGFAALFQTVLYLLAFIFILIIWPMYGVRGPVDATNPVLVLPALLKAPILSVFALLDVPIAVSLLLIVFALVSRVQDTSPVLMRVAMASGLVSVAFFLALGMIRFLGWPQLASLYVRDPASAETAYAALSAIDSGMDGAALFTLAWWALLASWAAVQTETLPKGLAYLGMLLGVAGIIGGVVPGVRPLALIVVLIWTPWLGIVLVRR